MTFDFAAYREAVKEAFNHYAVAHFHRLTLENSVIGSPTEYDRHFMQSALRAEERCRGHLDALLGEVDKSSESYAYGVLRGAAALERLTSPKVDPP